MTLPSSGAISLSDVNSNIGASSSAAITLNDTAVRWMANGDTTTNPVTIDNLHGKSWSWTSNVSQSGFSNFSPQATAADSSGYTYFATFTQGAGLFVFKLNPVGVVIWATQITANSGYTLLGTYRNGLAVSSSGNVYVSIGIQTTSPFPYTYWFGVFKLNSSGTLQWTSYLQTASSNFQENGSLGIDSSENVYSKAFQDFDGTAGAIVAKWNSSGTLQFQKKIELVYGGTGIGGIFTDPVNNYVYFCGLGNPTTYGVLIKYDTSLSQQWGTYIYTASGCRIDSLSVNTSNQNVYGAVSAPVTGVAKFNSSGTLQWQKLLQTGSTYMDIAADTNDNAYVQMDAVGSPNPYIIKVDTNGAISSQLQFSPNGMSYSGYNNMGGIAINGNSVITSLNTTTSSAPVNGGSAIKILNSLATTGTYGRVTMSTSSVTSANSSYTTGSITPTISNTSYSTNSGLVTGSNVTSSFTKAITLI